MPMTSAVSSKISMASNPIDGETRVAFRKTRSIGVDAGAGSQLEVTLWTGLILTSSFGTSRSTVTWTEPPVPISLMAATKVTDGRKEISKSISGSLRLELKGIGVRVDWLL